MKGVVASLATDASLRVIPTTMPNTTQPAKAAVRPYDAKKIASLRALVAGCPTWVLARERLVEKLKIHPDNATKMNRRHGFWVESDHPTPKLVDKGAARKLRRLFLDIETSPNVVLSWRIGYKINIDHDNLLTERAIICACWKWEGESVVHSAQWDKDQNDKSMLAAVLAAIDEADEIVMHNGDSFDLPWVKTRCLLHGLQTLPAYKTVDTLQWARRRFYFNSNRLDYIAKFLGLGGKIKTEFGLWKEIVLRRDAAAMQRMIDYCKKDVVLLEQVWRRLSEVMPHKSHAGVLAGGERWSCPKDGSTNVYLRQLRSTAAGVVRYEMRCRDCGSYYTIGEPAYEAFLAAQKDALHSAPSKRSKG